MANAYISFLGTNDYLHCTYTHETGDIPDVRFVQEATLSLFCRTWTSKDRVLIFTTEDAFRKNWLDDGHRDRKTGEPRKCAGLKRCIDGMRLACNVQRVPIPDGRSEAEIWEIFQTVYDFLNPGDKIIFDITHAFRSIPMLAIVILNYAKIMKGVSLAGIYYGAFEVLGSVPEARKIPRSKRRAPILDLTSFDQLMEWSVGIDRFTRAGDASMVGRLARQSVKQILKETKGRDETAAAIQRMAKNLEEYTEAMSTCRGRSISPITSRLRENIARIERSDLIEPFGPIFTKIRERAEQFTGDVVEDGIQAAKWCMDHQLIQQGYTILQETLITYSIIQIGGEPTDKLFRNIAGQAVKIFLKNLDRKKWKKPAADYPEITRRFLDFFKSRNGYADMMRNLSNHRNDLNHAGHKNNPTKPDRFRKKLPGYINEALRFVHE